jgi:sodium transport system ATP-binding protein
MDWMLQAEGLSKTFRLPRGKKVEAVREATFSVAPGEVFGLLGPNGAGKTTLLRMLATIITPSAGTCRINGQCAKDAPDAIRRQIGFLSGNTKLYGRLTAEEILRYFGRLAGMKDEAIDVRIERLVDDLDMAAIVHQRCETLSTGQTQKVSIARVLLHDPAVLILDEPTLGLDIMTSRTILDFILDAKKRGHCIVYSTHYMSEADMLCDRVGFIHEGRIMALGTREDLHRETGASNLHDAFLTFADRWREASV